jgi:hypothetical protein
MTMTAHQQQKKLLQRLLKLRDLAAANAARAKAAAEAKAVADAEQAAIDAAAYDPYEDASLYDAGGYVQSYSGPDYGGGGGQSDEDTVMSQPVTYTAPVMSCDLYGSRSCD